MLNVGVLAEGQERQRMFFFVVQARRPDLVNGGLPLVDVKRSIVVGAGVVQLENVGNPHVWASIRP